MKIDIYPQNENNILIYQEDNDITKVNVRFSDEDVWLTQAQLAEIYDTTQQNIALHIKNIYSDRELVMAINNGRKITCKYSLI